MLAETGSVSAAAQFVGMARETAYRLRRRADAAEFARAWDVALVIAGVMPASFLKRTACSRKVTPQPSWRQVVDGLWRPVLRRGRYVGSQQKPDNSALLGYLAQLDRSFRASQKDLRRELRSQTQKRPTASTPRAGPGGSAQAAAGARLSGSICRSTSTAAVNISSEITAIVPK